MEAGEVFAYSIYKLEDRGIFFIDPGTEVYVGMIVGANSRMGDLDVNICKNKKLTNVRASGSDDNVLLTPRKRLTLEEALEYLDDDELLEVIASDRHFFVRQEAAKRVHDRRRLFVFEDDRHVEGASIVPGHRREQVGGVGDRAPGIGRHRLGVFLGRRDETHLFRIPVHPGVVGNDDLVLETQGHPVQGLSLIHISEPTRPY